MIDIKEYEFEELTANNDITSNNKNEQNGDNNQSQDNTTVQSEIKNIIENAKMEAAKQTEIAKENAKKEGYEAGYKEGFEQGIKESKEKFNQIIEEYTEKLEKAISKLIETSNTINQKHAELENNATDAVLSIASKVIAKKIDEDKDVIASMIKEALSSSESNKIKIKLNPENAKSIEDKIEQISKNKIIEIVEDDKLSKGSILLEEENGNIIDAGVNAKLEQITNSIKNE